MLHRSSGWGYEGLEVIWDTSLINWICCIAQSVEDEEEMPVS